MPVQFCSINHPCSSLLRMYLGFGSGSKDDRAGLSPYIDSTYPCGYIYLHDVRRHAFRAIKQIAKAWKPPKQMRTTDLLSSVLGCQFQPHAHLTHILYNMRQKNRYQFATMDGNLASQLFEMPPPSPPEVFCHKKTKATIDQKKKKLARNPAEGITHIKAFSFQFQCYFLLAHKWFAFCVCLAV